MAQIGGNTGIIYVASEKVRPGWELTDHVIDKSGQVFLEEIKNPLRLNEATLVTCMFKDLR